MIRLRLFICYQPHTGTNNPIAVTGIKVQKGTTEIGKTSSLIRHMYKLIYMVIRTNRYIIMHAPRGIV